jgi:hypothetical protein
MVAKNKVQFPKLVGWKPTRDTLHAYCKVLGAIRAAYTPEQPRYQHISLRLYTSGVTTTPIPIPGNERQTFALSLDLRNHYVLLSTSEGAVQQMRMSEGLSATQLGEELLGRLAALGINGKVNKKKYEDDAPRAYVLESAEHFFTALSHVGQIFEQFKAGLDGQTDPIQFWPHHFDLSFILLGNKTVKTVEDSGQSQITVGFAPEDPGQPSAYFYVNPSPFEETVTHKKLPAGASWHTAAWQGALFPYSEIAESEDGVARVTGFLQAAYEAEKELI